MCMVVRRWIEDTRREGKVSKQDGHREHEQ
jgi:hypothetical protein